MKKITTLVSLTIAVLAGTAHAEVKLADNSKLLGKWLVTAEAAALDKEKKALNVSWEFKKDGILATRGEDTLGRTKELNIDVKYAVENGGIKKQTSPGREKYEQCTVVELNDKDMILKCQYLYYFLTKK